LPDEVLEFRIDHEAGLEISTEDNVERFTTHERMLPDLQIASITPNRYDIDRGESFSWTVEIENTGNGDVLRLTEIALIDLETGEVAATRVVPIVRRGQIETITLDIHDAHGQDLRFVLDSTEKVKETDEGNNSVTLSTLDVMTHDLSVVTIGSSEPVDYVSESAFLWTIFNAGPGRALEINVHVEVHHSSGAVTTLKTVTIASMDAGETTSGVTRYSPKNGDRIFVLVETPEQAESSPADNSLEVATDDLEN
jgi:hypothetical protein